MAENKIRISQLNQTDISGYVADIIADGVQVIGSTGPTGHPGEGTTGPSGATGPSGSTGPTGQDAGFTGPSGATGHTGHSGVDGVDGVDGIDGSTGTRGPTGPAAGPTGPSGSTGPTGEAGVGGSNTEFQYNNNGDFGGATNFVYASDKIYAKDVNFQIGKTGIVESQKSSGGKDAYMYVDSAYDDFIIRKEDQGLQFIIDGDLGNVGLHLPTGEVPTYNLDVSGEAYFRGESAQAVFIDHSTDSSAVSIKDGAGVTKVKLSSAEESWMSGGKVGINTAPTSSSFGELRVNGTIACSGIAVMHTGSVPVDSSSAGNKGEIRFDFEGDGRLYICVDDNDWRMVDLQTF